MKLKLLILVWTLSEHRCRNLGCMDSLLNGLYNISLMVCVVVHELAVPYCWPIKY